MFSSVQFSHSIVSDSLLPHELQHARPPSPSPTPGLHSDSRPSCWWCHPAISSPVVPFSSCPPIPPSIRVFSNESTLRMRWPKYWSFSFSISPSKEHPGLISGMLNSPATVLLWISSFVSVKICFLYLGVPILGVCVCVCVCVYTQFLYLVGSVSPFFLLCNDFPCVLWWSLF